MKVNESQRFIIGLLVQNLQEEVIIKIDGGISAESYLFKYSVCCPNDNKL